jgi:16S rRNA (uracil1498-N3)-methyltransferase
MKPLRVPLAALSPGRRELPEGPSRYVARVHRRGNGDALLLFDGAAGVEADAQIVDTARTRVIVEIAGVRAAGARARRQVTLLQCLGKGDKMDAIVRDATELGATTLVPVESARTIVKLGERAATRVARWRKIAEEAARQCGRGDVLEVEEPAPIDRVIARAEEDVRLVLSPRAVEHAGASLRALGDESVALLIGPEGGLDDAEIERAVASGFRAVSLGSLVLRTETVAAAMLGALAVLGESVP